MFSTLHIVYPHSCGIVIQHMLQSTRSIHIGAVENKVVEQKHRETRKIAYGAWSRKWWPNSGHARGRFGMPILDIILCGSFHPSYDNFEFRIFFSLELQVPYIFSYVVE
jgi:hypothetical protein